MDHMSEKIIKVLKDMDIEDATPESSLMGDLELESLQIYELLAEMEALCSVRIPERVLLKVDTVQDLADEITKLVEKKHD